MKIKNLMVKFYLGSMSWFTKTARFALRIMNSKWFKIAVGVYLAIMWFSALDNIVDTVFASDNGNLIALDAGHGYNTAGKRSYDEAFREWEINDKVADYVQEELEKQGFEIVRLDDVTGETDVDLNVRLAKAKKLDVDFVISIHQNAYGETWNNATGVESYYSILSSDKSREMAQKAAQKMSEYIGTVNRGAKGTTTELFINREFTKAGIDNVLTEGLFMSNHEDVAQMQTDEYIVSYGKAIVESVTETLKGNIGEAVNKIVRIKQMDDTLNIRSSASATSSIVGEVTSGEVFTIVETKNGFGKLASGAGWIRLSDKFVEEIRAITK